MSEPIGISLEEIRDFMLSKGGKVTNHELVKHFKDALTNQNTRAEARVLFKELVNTVATITRDPDGGKQLVLKKKYRQQPNTSEISNANTSNSSDTYSSTALPKLALSPETPINLRYTPVYQTSQDSSPIGETLGSPLSLKNTPPVFPTDGQGSPLSSASFSRRASQESILSQLSLRSVLSTNTVASSSPSQFTIASSLTSLPSSACSTCVSTTTGGSTNSSGSSGTLSSTASSYSSPSSSYSTNSNSTTSANTTTRTNTTLSRAPSQFSSDETVYYSERSTPTPTRDSFSSDPPPPVPPRRKSSSDKLRLELRESSDEFKTSLSSIPDQLSTSTPVFASPDQDNKENVANISKISVKERSQKFDRMASESALNKLAINNNTGLITNNSNNNNSNTASNNNLKKKNDKADKDEEDTGSVQLMDAKTREWLVRCAQGDYQALVKLAAQNPKLVKFKDPATGYTALHWGAKHDNLDIIKLIAGTHKADVNARTNGGYTPLHIATQYGHEEVCTQLVKVYKADENIRDYSGRKPRQYQKTSGTSISADTFRKIKARKKHAAEKDLGFLRIGSLNVRVKRTTEAFSNFLGVGNADKLHKHWGSADNIPQGEPNKRMPPPKLAPIKKRKSKRGQDFTASKPTVHNEHQVQANQLAAQNNPQQDSDSDTAAGFGSTWQSTV